MDETSSQPLSEAESRALIASSGALTCTFHGAGAIGTFGPSHVRNFTWPALEFVHAINYPTLVPRSAEFMAEASPARGV